MPHAVRAIAAAALPPLAPTTSRHAAPRRAAAPRRTALSEQFLLGALCASSKGRPVEALCTPGVYTRRNCPEECTEQLYNEPPKLHELGLTVDTSASDASVEAREDRIVKQLTSLKDSTSVVPLYHGDEDEANLGRLFWLADVVDAPYKHAAKMLLRAYVYDEEVVVLGAVTRVEYTAPAATKCDKQEGKCKKRNCQKWHWQPMDAGSVREPMLETQRDVKKHLKAVAGKQLTFTLSAGIANGVSDMIAQDDELYYGTVGTIG